MPLYAINCECGCREGMDTLVAREEQGGLVHCLYCDELNEIQIVPVALHGLEWPGGKYFAQVGRTFYSRTEMERWAASEGLAPVSHGSSEWRGLKDRNKNAGDREAKERGWRDAEDMHKTLQGPKGKDILAANRQKQIDNYHDEHGSEGKQSVEEAFGPLVEPGQAPKPVDRKVVAG